MIYIRVCLAFLGALLMIFCLVRISWQFILWTVKSMTERVPFLVEGDPRLKYRAEAIAWAVGLALMFLAAIL